MDSYNEDYGAGVNLPATVPLIGNTSIISRLSVGVDQATYASWQITGFYAEAYKLDDGSNTIVISYRGTDNLWCTTANAGGADFYGGYSLGQGEPDAPQPLQAC